MSHTSQYKSQIGVKSRHRRTVRVDWRWNSSVSFKWVELDSRLKKISRKVNMLIVSSYFETTHMIFLTADWAIPITWLQRGWPFINHGWWLSKPEFKKMATQIQKEYIKTVNCQKTSLDVLGRDSWTWTDCQDGSTWPRSCNFERSMNPRTQRKYTWHQYRASWNGEPIWKVRMSHIIWLIWLF